MSSALLEATGWKDDGCEHKGLRPPDDPVWRRLEAEVSGHTPMCHCAACWVVREHRKRLPNALNALKKAKPGEPCTNGCKVDPYYDEIRHEAGCHAIDAKERARRVLDRDLGPVIEPEVVESEPSEEVTDLDSAVEVLWQVREMLITAIDEAKELLDDVIIWAQVTEVPAGHVRKAQAASKSSPSVRPRAAAAFLRSSRGTARKRKPSPRR